MATCHSTSLFSLAQETRFLPQQYNPKGEITEIFNGAPNEHWPARYVQFTPPEVDFMLSLQVHLHGLKRVKAECGLAPRVFAAAHFGKKPWALRKLHAYFGLDQAGRFYLTP